MKTINPFRVFSELYSGCFIPYHKSRTPPILKILSREISFSAKPSLRGFEKGRELRLAIHRPAIIKKLIIRRHYHD
jgi:hypothetical protein